MKSENYLTDAKKLSYFQKEQLDLLQENYNNLNKKFEGLK